MRPSCDDPGGAGEGPEWGKGRRKARSSAVHQIGDIGSQVIWIKPKAQMKSAYSLTTASPPRGSIAGMPSRKTLLGLVDRAAAMVGLAGIIMRLFGIA
jgi:hypothetical protein